MFHINKFIFWIIAVGLFGMVICGFANILWPTVEYTNFSNSRTCIDEIINIDIPRLKNCLKKRSESSELIKESLKEILVILNDPNFNEF